MSTLTRLEIEDGSTSIWMILRGLRGEVLRIADHAVVETGADREQHVTVLHRHVGFIRAVHSQHADELAVAGLEAAQTHQRAGAWESEQIDQPVHEVRGVRQDHAAAGVDHRALGREQQLHRLLDLPLVPLDHRLVRAHFDFARILVLGARDRHVLRNIDQDRAGPAGSRDVKRLLHRRRQFAHVLHKEVVLDAWPRDADGVALLERVLADCVRRHLAGDDDERNRVHVGGRDARDRIGDARAAGHERHSDALARTRISIRGVHCRLLVAY